MKVHCTVSGKKGLRDASKAANMRRPFFRTWNGVWIDCINEELFVIVGMSYDEDDRTGSQCDLLCPDDNQHEDMRG